MPYTSIDAAKTAGFPTTAEGIALTLTQINKLAEIYDAIQKAGTAKNPMAMAWTAWKKLYRKDVDRWVKIKAAAIQFGTEPFTATSDKPDGIPDHAAMIEGRVIHLNTKNLKGWGVTAAAAEQIIEGFPEIPIRVCNDLDPHACDYNFDNFANIGYVTDARIEDGWIIARAAITDQEAIKKINDNTWLPFGKGGWSVTGYPSDPVQDFETSGLTNGFIPTSIALIIGNGKPAFEGSGFEVVAAAINNYRGNINMTNKSEGGDGPVMYDQDALDAAVKDALDKQKVEYEASIEKLKAEMTPTTDVEKMIAAAVARGQEDTIEAIRKDELVNEYQKMLTSTIIGAPFMTDGVLDQTKIDAKMTEVRNMTSAAIAKLINEAKLLVSAATHDSTFENMEIPGTPPGAETQESKDMAVCEKMIGVI